MHAPHGRAAMLRGFMLCVVCGSLAIAAACSSDTDRKAMPELRTYVEAGADGHSGPRGHGGEAAAAFYRTRGFAPVWLDGDEPAAMAADAVQALAAADDHALRPDDYDHQTLSREHTRLAGGDKNQNKTARRQELARFELRLTTALLTLGRDVAIGRTDPRRADPRWKRQRESPDLPAALEKAIADKVVKQWADRLRPVQPDYMRLQKAWAALRPHRGAEWPRVPNVTLRPGQSHAAVAALRQRLIASGELRAAPPDPRLTRYDAPLADAVRAFQEHHGLKATAIVDARTAAALNVPLARRLQQVALNLERWRWMPDDLGARHIRVNIPRFYVDAYENHRSVLSIRAIVGREGDETPVFSEAMTHVVLSPYWNIPPAIVADETLPEMERDPEFLSRNNIEIVRVSGKATEVLDPADLDWTDEETMKGVAFRQRPGSTNALGFVKFMFPNPFNVYIHDTPADGLFQRLGRTLSHGCVRIEDPVAFAEYVLRDQPQWTRDAIVTTMHSGTEKHIKLNAAIPVHIVYFTAWADELGGLHFRDDVYGFDVGRKIRTAAVASAS